jgi:hypothetical protein
MVMELWLQIYLRPRETRIATTAREGSVRPARGENETTVPRRR